MRRRATSTAQVAHARIDAPQRGAAGLQPLVGQVHRLPVVLLQQEEADLTGGIALLLQVGQGDAGVLGVGHLLAAHQHELAVQPEVGLGLTGERAALGDLVLIVWEDQIH